VRDSESDAVFVSCMHGEVNRIDLLGNDDVLVGLGLPRSAP
jgi:hypothetical protein